MAYVQIFRTVSVWKQGISETYTIQVLPQKEKEDNRQTLQKILSTLQKNVNVSTASVLNEKNLKSMLSPWIGSLAYDENFTIPTLIDVRVKKNHSTSTQALEESLKSITSHISVYSHQKWLQHIIHIFSAVSSFSLLIVFLTFLAALMTTIFSVQVGIKTHLKELEILHIAGAFDSYIARQFASHSQWLVLKGAAIGLLATFPVFWLIYLLFSPNTFILGISVPMPLVYWLVTLLPPLIMIIVARLSAWQTVMRTLKKMN